MHSLENIRPVSSNTWIGEVPNHKWAWLIVNDRFNGRPPFYYHPLVVVMAGYLINK